jgi:ribonuclease R
MACKFELGGNWPKQWQEQLSEDNSEREDRTATAFVTIDAPSTQDMDDALWAEATDNGWQLSIAIADPSAMLAAGSALDQEALRRATSVYMPGFTVPMLPEELSNRRCSLTPGDDRPAMVCDMQVDSGGNITDYRLSLATVRSSAKLSYQDVAAFIDQQQAIEGVDAEALIQPLVDVTQALLTQRKRDHLVVEGRPEFRLILNAERKIDRIEPLVKTSAHQLVEECMVAANRCAADFMGEHGLFSSHAGFRSERLEGVTKLAEEQVGISGIDLASLDGYRQLINAIDDAQPFPTRSVLARMLERGQLSCEPAPHYGMGLQRYTTFTSPIRKYSDLLVHRQIKAKLQQQTAEPISEQTLAQLQAGLDAARQARQQMEQWLKCQYIASEVGQTASGIVCQINSNGFTVRLDNGVEGFVDTRLLKEKYSFDPLRLRLSGPSLTVELEQRVDVVIQEVDDKQRNIQFTLPAQENAPA